MLRLKERGRVQRVVVAGCLAERDREALLDRYPQIDRLIGVFARDEIAAACGAGVPPALKDAGETPAPQFQRAFFRPPPARRCRIAAGGESPCATWLT